MRRTVNQLITSVGRISHGMGVKDKTLIKEFLQDAQETMCEEYRWPFFLARKTSITLVASTAEYNLPADFHSVDRLWYPDSDRFMELNAVSDSEYFTLTSVNETGTPLYYRFMGIDTTNYRPKIQVSPAPNASFISTYGTILYVEQYTIPEDINDLADTAYPAWPGEFHKVLKWGAIVQIATAQGDTTLLGTASTLYKKFLDELSFRYRMRYGRPFSGNVPRFSAAHPQRSAGATSGDYR